MRIRIDLKIFIFFALFYFTHQIKIYLTIMFYCIIHELGHIIMGLLLKLRPNKLEIMPCGLSVSFKVRPEDLNFKMKKGNLLEFKNALVAISGPLVSLILTILYTYFDPIYITKQDAIYSNLLILLFNLIPLYPLDGGIIIKSILHIELGSKKAQILTRRFSNITMIILTVISSIAIYYYKNIAIFLICIFLWIITIRYNRGRFFSVQVSNWVNWGRFCFD